MFIEFLNESLSLTWSMMGGWSGFLLLSVASVLAGFFFRLGVGRLARQERVKGRQKNLKVKRKRGSKNAS